MTQTYDTPQEAEDAFYDALDEGDLNRMLSVWAEADDICCLLPMHPMIQGREAVTGVFTHLFSEGHGVSLSIAHLGWIETDDIAIHQVEETIEDPVARRHAVGNNLADLAAKAGLKAHRSPTDRQAQEAARLHEKLKSIAVVLACTCKLWPSSKVFNGKLVRREALARREAPVRQRARPASAQRESHCIREYIDEEGGVLRVCIKCAQTGRASVRGQCPDRPRGSGNRALTCCKVLETSRKASTLPRICT